ncbi:MAG: SdrD B-like domain-containing protein, partial [Pseudomonadota bacterium]
PPEDPPEDPPPEDDYPANGILGGTAWFDTNGDGVRQKQEPVEIGLEIVLLDHVSIEIDRTRTKSTGRYRFNGVPREQPVTLQLVDPEPYITPPRSGDNPDKDSDFEPHTRQVADIRLGSMRKDLRLGLGLSAVAPPPRFDVAVWAHDGGIKVPQEIARSADQEPRNSVWDGLAVRLFAARNEIVSFNLVVDNLDSEALSSVRVEFSQLESPGYRLATTDGESLFDWRSRPIEVFVVRYLKIHGLSRLSYDLYDETHTPLHLQRPYTDYQPIAPAVGIGGWSDRPHHDLSYPDIAVPQEIARAVQLAPDESQSFWIDVAVPRSAPSGLLSGEAVVRAGDAVLARIPVELEVLDLTLPDAQSASTMVHIEAREIKERYFTGAGGTLLPEDASAFRAVMDRHFQLGWRHGISLIDLNELLPDAAVPTQTPHVDWLPRFDGTLYSAARGYAGPGAGLGHDVFSIGSYSAWTYWWGVRRFDPVSPEFDPDADPDELRAIVHDFSDAWENWFTANAPDVERFLYVDDEPEASLGFTEQVAGFLAANPGPGGNLASFVTANAVQFGAALPSADILAAWYAVAPTAPWDAIATAGERRLFQYNGRRPASGSFAIEDDGVALRELPWGQVKKGIERWFFWHSTYYNNFQGGPATRDLSQVDPEGPQYRAGAQTNVWKSAHTFGGHDRFDATFGETGWNYSNGDGVLFYPGTDRVFPEQSRELAGPIASLRLKQWRRGLQDMKYLALARAVDPDAANAIVDAMVPSVLWEVDVHTLDDPTYVHRPPSWSIDPDDWESARRQLADIALNPP